MKRPACTTLSGSGRGVNRSASHLLAHPRPHPGLSGLRAMHYLLRQAVQASKLPRFQSRLLQGGNTLSEPGILPLGSAVLLRERSQQGCEASDFRAPVLGHLLDRRLGSAWLP